MGMENRLRLRKSNIVKRQTGDCDCKKLFSFCFFFLLLFSTAVFICAALCSRSGKLASAVKVRHGNDYTFSSSSSYQHIEPASDFLFSSFFCLFIFIWLVYISIYTYRLHILFFSPSPCDCVMWVEVERFRLNEKPLTLNAELWPE